MSEELRTKFHLLVDEAWNKGNLDVVEEVIAPDYVEHHSLAQDVEGLEAFKQMIIGTRRSFPDFHLTIHDSIMEGESLAIRWSWQGTHSEQTPIFKIPPTGKKLKVVGAQIFHHKGGKLVEGWQYTDDLGVFQQLGINPQLAVTE